MDRRFEKLLDGIGRKILEALQNNARLPWRRLGLEVGLSAPAVAERVQKLEEAGIIRGYHTRIDPVVMGRAVAAFIQLTTDPRHYPAVKATAVDMPEVLTCHHVSGEASFIIEVRVGDVRELEAVVVRLSRFGQTRTAVVLSTPVDKTATLPLR
jgi:Lrp/AsnC family leucine-responsive transcriptional regulator